jgi:hypothetical protein
MGLHPNLDLFFMTQDEIIEMAREAGEAEGMAEFVFHPVIERFAALVASAEREACAKLCDEFPDVGYIDEKLTSDYHAHLIRQRGQA